ncbi:MAG: aldolase/citrate lyase family protein [Chloroflexota bacterium]
MKNTLKEKLKKGQAVIGTFVGLGHPDVTEMLSKLGFDWLVIDGEHSPIGFETIQKMMQPMDAGKCTPVVRPQWNDMVVIKRVLDIGAYGVLVPWVNTKEDAEYAVRACRYPPAGLRGVGPRRAALSDPSYFETANDELLIIPQIETAKALSNLDGIFSAEGIDACFVGPWDLSFDMGFGPPRWDNPAFVEAFDKVLNAARKSGKPAGMYCTQDNIEWAIEKGFKINTVDNADAFLMRSARLALKKARGPR